jgi:hypothetical protein|tara:strand:+ start:4967 stop:6007 length:1041 start_codon:yes stop_codon:yes gene_type:complete
MSGPNDEVTIHEQIELFGLKNYVSMHPEREKDALIAHGAVQDEGKDITFLHRGFCSVGLPLRNPIKNTNAGSKSPIWSKSDGDFTLSITGSDFHMDENQQEFRSGIPYGPKARLIAMYIADQIHDPRRSLDDRSVEFGGITQWLTNAGVGVTGGKRGSITATKEQLVRFLFARFTMIMRAKRGSLFGDDDEENIWFQGENLIEAGVFHQCDLKSFMAGEYAKISWPSHVHLTDNTYNRFRKHSVPISATRLKTISNNASAMDIFCWLSYRLPKIPKGENVLVRWSDLLKQFGDSSQESVFRRRYDQALKAAALAYPEAKFDVTAEGLVLHHSDPAVARKVLVGTTS